MGFAFLHKQSPDWFVEMDGNRWRINATHVNEINSVFHIVCRARLVNCLLGWDWSVDCANSRYDAWRLTNSMCSKTVVFVPMLLNFNSLLFEVFGLFKWLSKLIGFERCWFDFDPLNALYGNQIWLSVCLISNLFYGSSWTLSGALHEFTQDTRNDSILNFNNFPNDKN